MKNSRLFEKILHFLPFWLFGLAVFMKIILLLTEFSLSFADNKKLFYDFQDSRMGRDELPGVIFFIAFILSFTWIFLIFFLRRKKELSDRWCCAIGFFPFPTHKTMKFLIGLFFFAVGFHLIAVECQMLLPEKEQKEILSGRWYPPHTKLRLSAAAVKDGYAALDKKDLDIALKEFNRAWRFNPKNMDAYWGAAIVMGLYAEKAKTTDDAKKLIEKSLKLFEIAKKHLSGNIREKENWQLDYAASLYSAGKILFKSDKKAAEKYFLEAEKIWLPLLKDLDIKKQRDALVYYRICWHLTKLYRDWGKEDLYKKHLNILPEKLRKGL